MEKLHILPNKRGELVLRNGCGVLGLSYPVVSGNTAAAEHTAQLIACLAAHARNEAANRAEVALKNALRSGRLFDFTRHTYQISVTKTEENKHVCITLTAHLSVGGTTVFHRTLSTRWDKAERIQHRARLYARPHR
ncbi:MAG: hypothetical protein IKC75_05465 [Clostridia bacterium]|nr:hypothetical protein [Clostridia bacterium]